MILLSKETVSLCYAIGSRRPVSLRADFLLRIEIIQSASTKTAEKVITALYFQALHITRGTQRAVLTEKPAVTKNC